MTHGRRFIPNSAGQVNMTGLPQSSGELPTSTLAAQLVNNLTRGKQHSNHQDRADFENLLQIFEAEKNGEQQAEIAEDVGESAKLIDVVIKAGLDALSRENPFEGLDTLGKKASRSLGVIEVTIRRCPDVLFFQAGGQGGDPRLCAPLYLWLVPKLLVVAANEPFQELRPDVATVLHSSMAMEQKVRSKGARLNRISRYIQGCIKGKVSQ